MIVVKRMDGTEREIITQFSLKNSDILSHPTPSSFFFTSNEQYAF